MPKSKINMPIVFTPDSLKSHLDSMASDREREIFLKWFRENCLIVCKQNTP